MKTPHHSPAYDFECEDACEDAAATNASAVSTTAHRKLRGRRVFSGTEGEDLQLLVTCPLRGVTVFEECSACPRFKGFSLDPAGVDSYITCTTTADVPLLPIPENATARGRAMRTPIVDIMSDPVCVRPDVPVKRLARIFGQWALSGVPVVDELGRGVGFVTKTDLMAVLDSAAPRSPMLVQDIMTRDVEAIPATSTLLTAIDRMAATRRRRITVVSDTGVVVGVISTTDVNAWFSRTEAGSGWSALPPQL